jgi:hypothetical protein
MKNIVRLKKKNKSCFLHQGNGVRGPKQNGNIFSFAKHLLHCSPALRQIEVFWTAWHGNHTLLSTLKIVRGKKQTHFLLNFQLAGRP